MSAKKTSKLSAALLVRKGDASPTGYGAGRKPSGFSPVLVAGSDTGKTPAPRRRRTSSSATSSQVRVSVRMGIAEHLRLKLASAHVQRSMSNIVIDALETYIADLAPGIEGGACGCLNTEADREADAEDEANRVAAPKQRRK